MSLAIPYTDLDNEALALRGSLTAAYRPVAGRVIRLIAEFAGRRTA